jgi:transposase-like protein
MEKVDRQYPVEFRRQAVERMRGCRNITALARELGVSRPRLYRWKRDVEHPDARWGGKYQPEDTEKRKLVEQLQSTQRLLAQKAVELDFVKGALHRVEARRRKSGSSGETTSTGRCEK